MWDVWDVVKVQKDGGGRFVCGKFGTRLAIQRKGSPVQNAIDVECGRTEDVDPTVGFGDQLQGMFRSDGLQHVTKGFHHGNVGGRFGGRRGVLRLWWCRRHGWVQ